LLDHVRDVLRVNHYSVRTEEAYVGWIRRFILYHNKKHPREMGALEVELYLTHLAVGEKVSANTQKQALNALAFLYHRVLQKPLGQFRDISRPKKPQRRPLVLSKNEVERILQVMSGMHQLIATLLFGTGMRLLECMRLRVKDVDLALNQIVIRDGKGWKDRVTMLPQRIKADLEKHLAAFICLTRWSANFPTQIASGHGSTFFRPLRSRRTPVRANAAGTTCTRIRFKKHCTRQCALRTSQNRPLVTHSGIPLLRSCCQRVTTSAQCRNCWVIHPVR
jgi:integrase